LGECLKFVGEWARRRHPSEIYLIDYQIYRFKTGSIREFKISVQYI
jgi:hypothetical protein